VKFSAEPNWTSWADLADFFTAYYNALEDLGKRLLAARNAHRADSF
jgi:hypothetical protein